MHHRHVTLQPLIQLVVVGIAIAVAVPQPGIKWCGGIGKLLLGVIAQTVLIRVDLIRVGAKQCLLRVGQAVSVGIKVEPRIALRWISDLCFSAGACIPGPVGAGRRRRPQGHRCR